LAFSQLLVHEPGWFLLRTRTARWHWTNLRDDQFWPVFWSPEFVTGAGQYAQSNNQGRTGETVFSVL